MLFLLPALPSTALAAALTGEAETSTSAVAPVAAPAAAAAAAAAALPDAVPASAPAVAPAIVPLEAAPLDPRPPASPAAAPPMARTPAILGSPQLHPFPTLPEAAWPAGQRGGLRAGPGWVEPAAHPLPAEDELLHLDQLLDRLAQLEEKRQQGVRDAWRGALWLGLAVAASSLGFLAADLYRTDLPLPASWTLCGAAGALLGFPLTWRGLARYRAADEELEQVDRALTELQQGEQGR